MTDKGSSSRSPSSLNGHSASSNGTSSDASKLWFALEGRGGGPEGGAESPEEDVPGEAAAEEEPLEDLAEPEPLDAPPAVILERMAACVRYVASRYKVALDGKPETLSLLDQYTRDARAEIAKNPDALELLVEALGAYFGEVVRQYFRGFWRTEGDPFEWRLEFETVYLTFNPLGMAREALVGQPSEGWHAHLELDEEDRLELEARLENLGGVDEEEYYLPTTRFDVIEMAVDLARRRMKDRGLGDVTFGPSDYR